MNEPNASEESSLAATQNLWDTYLSIMASRGLDLHAFIKKLMDPQIARLSESGAATDYRELCDSGCAPPILSLIIAFGNSIPMIEDTWREFVGSANERLRVARLLEKTAASIEALLKNLLVLGGEESDREFSKKGLTSPLRLVSDLRLYAQLLNTPELVSDEIKTYSLVEISRYVLTAYSETVTGKFHDRNVSGLLAASSGPVDYNETAHRMWRNRNYDRINQHLSTAIKFLHELGVAMIPQA